MSGVLQSDGLSVRYAGNVAVSGVNIGVPAGRMVGLVGANGAGKTTLVNALAGWSRGRAVVTGSVQLEGRSIEKLAAHERVARGLTLVPEGKNIFAELTVDENLRTGAAARGYDRPASLHHPRGFRVLPAPRRAPLAQGRGALRRRAADARGRARLARRPARADAGRAFRGPRAAADHRPAAPASACWSIAACRCCWSSRTSRRR